MKRILRSVLWGIVAYVIGAFVGGYCVSLFSSNQHDKAREAAMTGTFVLGPLAGMVGFAVGFLKGKTTESPVL